MLCRIALFFLAVSLYAQVPFNQFVVFGDSLSDNGNLYIGTKLLGDPTPGPPMYATGEYTDGTNSVPSTSGPLGLWIEQLAAIMNLPVPQPFASASGGSNYAVAGALTGINPKFSPAAPTAVPNLTDQLNLFLAAKHTPAVNALYVFWGGSNDILQSVNPAATAAANVQGNIDTLATAGAKYFLWANLTPLGEVPESINTSNRSALDAASVAYNQAMNSAIAQLKTAHPGITIVTLDAYSLFLASTQNPSLYGYTNVTSPAQGMNVNPNTYLFWDMLHPTTVGHSYIAKAAYSAIEFAFGGPVFSCTNTTPPQIASIDSASAYGGYSYFASGSWLEIKGTNLADPADPRLSAATHPGEWTTADFSGLNAPTVLDGISVSIDGKPAAVWYLSPGQLNVQAPEDATLGSVKIAVTNCKAASAPFMFTRQALAPGLLAPASFNVGGTQYLVATFPSDAAYVLSATAAASLGVNGRPAKPGDLIVAYGIGFGDVTPSILPGIIAEQSNTLVDPVAVSFGSTNATLAYSGLAGNFVGLYEFYINVPSTLANGDYQINVTQNGAALPQTFYLTVHN
jgi:uncharacterized protein (TIGR03437 family)